MTRIGRAAAVCVAAAIGLTFTPATAQAATPGITPEVVTGCSVPFGSSACRSLALHANHGGHWLSYSGIGGFTCARADLQIIDATNEVVVFSRHFGTNGASGYVNGLYSLYYVRIFNSCGGGQGSIGNGE